MTLKIERHGIATLNVAGPSAHKVPQGEGYARAVLGEALRLMGWCRRLE